MPTTPTYGPNQQLPSNVAGPIQSQIAAIQAGINSISSGSSGGSGGSSGGSSSSGSSGVGAVNAQGQLIGSNGQVIGTANPADTMAGSRPGRRVQPEGVAPQLPTSLDPSVQAPPPDTQYTVKPGDTVSTIAKAQGVPMNAISGYASGDPNKIGVGETLTIAQQYQNAHALAQQSGVPAAQGAGAGYSGAQQFMQATQGPQEEAPSMMTPAEDLDPQISNYLVDYDDFHSPDNQRKSLVEEYQTLSKSLGLEALNEKLINAEAIINGTESDIRLEVEKASGFATDSQVMALANARNKSLIANYNKLLATKSAITTQLSTLMQLSVQDRQFAQAEFDRKLDFAFRVADYKQKAINNTRENYKWMIENGGGANILLDPRATASAERSLGIPSGGLAGIIAQQKLALEEDRLGLDLKREQIATEKAQRANIYSQINERETPSNIKTIDGKPQNASQASANSYANRLTEADKIIGSLGGNFTKMSSFGNLLPNQFQSSDRQLYEQAKKNFITAVLRRESGASISPTEFSTAEKQYFPQAGDKPATVQQKATSRNTVINNFYNEANIARPVQSGDVVEVGGKKYKVDSNGDMQPI